VELRCAKIGRTSFDLAYRVLGGDGLPVAEGRTVQVMMDFGSGRPAPIGAATRAWLEGQA
jgi:acyl-CoA thioesterase FadM